jgi:hypothetical protein
VSFFESEVVGYAAVSYGRRTGSLRVDDGIEHESRA